MSFDKRDEKKTDEVLKNSKKSMGWKLFEGGSVNPIVQS